MKCIYCGFEHTEPFQFCPSCGAYNRYAAPVNIAAQQLLPALKSNLFLVICIMLSISCGFSLISGSPSIITILSTIFLWIIFANSRKNIVDSKQLKNISGTVFAGYVINYVLGGLMIFLGAVFALIFIFVSTNSDAYSAFWEGFAEGLDLAGMSIYEFEDIIDDIGLDIEEFASLIGWLFFLIFTVTGVVTIIFNALGTKKIHSLAKSAYKSVEMGYLNLEKLDAAKSWLIVLGVFSAVSALSSLAGEDFLTAIAGSADAAAMIIAGVLINKSKAFFYAPQPQQMGTY